MSLWKYERVDALQAVADPVRRRVVEALADGERTAGELVETIGAAFGLGQSGTSKHLQVLRTSGVVTSRVAGKQRIYRLRPEPFVEMAAWAERQTRFWNSRLDALTEALTEDDDDR
jgi:DNA-binding transcriptional ArsR family regulator